MSAEGKDPADLLMTILADQKNAISEPTRSIPRYHDDDEDEEEEPEDEEDEEGEEAPENAPKPKRGKGFMSLEDRFTAKDLKIAQSGTAEPSKSTFAKLGKLALKFPGADRFLVYKRDKLGAQNFITSYGIRDLDNFSTIDELLLKYVVPKFGGGTYKFEISDAQGKHISAGETTIMYDDGSNNALKDAMKILTEAAVKPPPDPVKSMSDTMNLMKSMSSGEGKNDMMAVALMTMMQQQQKPAVDPMLLSLLDKMSNRLEKLETSQLSAPAPMPMPMPAPAAPSLDFASLLGAVTPLIAAFLENSRANQQAIMAAQAANAVRPGEMLQMMMTSHAQLNQNALSTKDVIELLRARDEESKPKHTIEDQFAAVAKTKEMLEAYFPQPTQGSDTFGVALLKTLGGMLNNPNLGDIIAARLAPSAPKQAEVRTLPAQTPTLPQPQLTPEQIQEIRIQQMADRLPDALQEHMARVLTATEAHTRIGYTLQGLVSISEHEFWKPFIDDLLAKTMAGQKEEALKGLNSWLRLVVLRGFLTAEVAQTILQDIDAQFDTLLQVLFQQREQSPVLAPEPTEEVEAATAPEQPVAQA